jgi:hypothetical protein
MIRDLLIPAIKEAFPDKPFVFGDTPDPIAKLSSGVAEIGDLLIHDDDEEATISISEITHGHFNTYDKSLTRDQIDVRVTEMVIGFLRALFSDHVLLYRTPSRSMGGWSVLTSSPDEEKIVKGREYFLWSGPYKK